MTLNLRQIEIFRAVMTTGSISGASQLLFVSQPAVSRLLSHTEQRVGFALFERIKGRLYATPEAKKLFHEVESVYQAVRRVNDLASDLSKNRRGILNIVSSPSVGQMLIPEALALFRARHPDVKLTFQCLGYGYLKERLLSHQADLGIIILPMEHPNLEVAPLCRNRLVCILPYDHELTRRATLTLADLRPYPLISYEKESPFGGMVARMYQEAGEPLNAAIEVGSPQNAGSLVQMGAGVALVDEFSVRSWASNSQLVVRPVENAPILQANLVHMRFEPLSQLTQAFITQLQQLVQQQGFGMPADELVADEAPAELLAA
jgi:DNA-binding transcriptional LysR family regulator